MVIIFVTKANCHFQSKKFLSIRYFNIVTTYLYYVILVLSWKIPLREKCPYSQFFWSVFSLIRIEYGEILSISPYLVRMWENEDQKNSEYSHFSPSVTVTLYSFLLHAFLSRCARVSIDILLRVLSLIFSED